MTTIRRFRTRPRRNRLAAFGAAALLTAVAACSSSPSQTAPPSSPFPASVAGAPTAGAATTAPRGAPPAAYDWPDGGQAALLVDGQAVPVSSGETKPTPTASVAKVMTAYVFLKTKPLAPGASGPTFTISAEEANRYGERARRFESLTPVTAGERFTQRRALEALMVVSANNIAHEIARWVAGGDAAFVARMNSTARELGMTATTYTDPSGFDRTTVSTAVDQVKLFTAAMRDPAFAEIAGVRTYTAPGNRTQPNGNTLLGKDGVIAGKTGFTTPAGANLVFAAEREIDGVQRRVVGAVMAQHTGNTAAAAIEASDELIRSVGEE
ncbi:hypothetical protein GCM10023205_48800 [Yinghuangia aomiensis]|uniref:Peptidase S11 D-alanyl-D-alanine carboxypeptidase A N-terminal domain-containing protein n=1 Tax=Yinghuangia aomiensis TaxID=676205 RepID=A0ABP9HQ18_9ACTN